MSSIPPSSVQSELEAILYGAAFAPISARGYEAFARAFLRITGPDATRWLNGMVTNSVQSLQRGEGNYNFLLNAQGRIQGDCTIFREPGDGDPTFLLETGSSELETVSQLLNRYIIMDDVELQTISDRSGISVLGLQALSMVMALGTGNHRAAPCSQAAQAPPSMTLNLKQTAYAGAPVSLILAHSPLVPCFEIWSDSATTTSILAELRESDAIAVSSEALEAFRILSGTPRFGTDIRDRDLPQETNQPHALHFAKGCYLGQEIVERIRSRGQVHRLFTAFTLEGELPTSLPAPLEANGKPAGEITSAARMPLPEGEAILALGYARREALDTKQLLAYSGGTAVLRVLSS